MYAVMPCHTGVGNAKFPIRKPTAQTAVVTPDQNPNAALAPGGVNRRPPSGAIASSGLSVEDDVICPPLRHFGLPSGRRHVAVAGTAPEISVSPASTA